jgi:hypothetical protein
MIYVASFILLDSGGTISLVGGFLLAIPKNFIIFIKILLLYHGPVKINDLAF